MYNHHLRRVFLVLEGQLLLRPILLAFAGVRAQGIPNSSYPTILRILLVPVRYTQCKPKMHKTPITPIT